MNLKHVLREVYRRLPVVREVSQIRDTLWQLRAELKDPAIIRLLDFNLAEHPRYSNPLRLFRSSFQVSAQNGEDGIIREIFRRIQTTSRVFVEIGVGDGAENNTSFLIALGWKGFWIDGDASFLAALQQRPDLRDDCVRGIASFVTKENVADLLTQLQVPSEFDLLSIDIDQNTYHIWEALSAFRPRAVVVEYNASLPPDVDWKVHYDPRRTWDGTQNFGASLKAFELLGKKMGYSLVGAEFTGVNAFFVRDDLVTPDKFCSPFTSENHYEPPRYRLAVRRGHPASILDRPNAS
jgi:hypothetical protein